MPHSTSPHIPLPTSCHHLFFLNTPLNPISAARVCMDMWPSSRAQVNLAVAAPAEPSDHPSSSHQLPTAPQLGVRPEGHAPVHAALLSSLVSSRQPQLPWVLEQSGPAVARRCHVTVSSKPQPCTIFLPPLLSLGWEKECGRDVPLRAVPK